MLTILNRLDIIDVDAVVNYTKGLQNEDGSFCGEKGSTEFKKLKSWGLRIVWF